MKIIYIFILLSFLFTHLTAQDTYPSSNNITVMGQWDNDELPEHVFGTFNDIWGYVADDREYIIMGSASHVHFFDVTDPENLVEIARFEPGSSITWRDFKVYENYVYGVSDNSGEGLAIYDMSNVPNSVDSLSLDSSVFPSAHNCFIDEPNGRLYIVGSLGSVIVFDLTNDPTNPELMAITNLDGIYIHDIYVRDNIAYCSGAYDGYYIYDLTDPTNPIYIASLLTNGYNHSSWVTEDGKYALFAEEVPKGLPLGIMDLNNMMEDELQVSTYFQRSLTEVENPEDTRSTAHNPYILGDLAYVSYYEDGVHIYDISDPTEPTLFGFLDTYPSNIDYSENVYEGCWGMYPYLPSGNLFASDMDNGLFSFKITNPTNTDNSASFANNIKIAPNPVHAVLTVNIANYNKNNFIYSITNTLGQIIETGDINSSRLTIDTHALSDGIYYLNILTDNEMCSKKFIKQ